MRPLSFSPDSLRKLLLHDKIATLPDLKRALGTDVDLTVFRKLKQLDYLTSYSHRGRFYTLREIARFGAEGLWSCEPAWFSRYGTLLATAEAFIRSSAAGHFAEELSEILHVGAQDVLRQLVQQKRIARELISGLFLYTSIDPATRQRQRLTRRSNQSIPTVVDASGLEVSPDEMKAAIILFYSLLDEQQKAVVAGRKACSTDTIEDLSKIRVAVVGVGQFGRNHVRVVRQAERAELVAVVDVDATRAAEAAEGCLVLTDYRDLRGRVDAAIVAAPTLAHAEIGCELMGAGIDVLVEKPIAADLASADRLIETARACGRILQVGHLERYNPAVIALERVVTQPLFFEIHRLNLFSPRSLDVDIVLDLMIHDLDIVLRLAGEAKLEEIRAAGISILSQKVDIGNVRLQFSGGCVANLTASRVSTERVRKLRLFQPQEYISLDYSKQHAVKFHVGADRQISFAELPVAKGEPLALQFEAFLSSVETRSEPKLSGAAARHTLDVALAILDKMEEHSQLVAQSLVTGWTP